MHLGIADVEHYESQLQQKIEFTQAEFLEFHPPQLEVFPSPSSHFRMRAEFKIWHQDDACHYAMYAPGEYKKPFKIDEFSIGSKTICALMPKLLEQLNKSEILRRKLFQVEFLTTTHGSALVTLIYHKPLNDAWKEALRQQMQNLPCQLIGRSRKQKVVLDEDYVVERFQLNSGEFSYQQVETGFTQPNGYVCQDMLNWACAAANGLGGDLLELYCGNGNFTLPLSMHYEKVLATEVSKTSVNSALYNIEQNKRDNIAIARLSSEEFTQAMNGEREFRRLKEINLSLYNFTTVFVDPPRAGLDQDTVEMVSGFENIIYISCNPETLKDNLKQLNRTHTVEKFALFDQFPYTHHRECGVLLKRRELPNLDYFTEADA